MPLTLKKYCEENNIDINNALELVVGHGDDILPQVTGFQGYFGEITDSALVCTNEKLGVIRKEIPFSSFKSAEFGIGSAQLWLQCVVDESPFVFCLRRSDWKKPSGKLLLRKIGEHTEILGMKEYNGYTGKLFFLYMWK